MSGKSVGLAAGAVVGHVLFKSVQFLTKIVDSPLQDIRPRYSPDGKRIAFTSHRDGNAELYLMDADGTNVRRLTDHAERDDYPTWNSDGTGLAAVCERGFRLCARICPSHRPSGGLAPGA